MLDIRFVHLHGARLVPGMFHRLIAELLIGLAPYFVEPQLPGPPFILLPDFLSPLLQEKLLEPGQLPKPDRMF